MTSLGRKFETSGVYEAVTFDRPRPEPGTRSSDLLLIALLLGVCFLFYGFIVPRTPGRVGRPSAALTSEFPLWSRIVALPLPVPQTAAGVAASLIGVGILTFGLYGVAFLQSRSLRPSRTALAAVLVPGLLYSASSVVHLPNVNTDIFNYIMRGRVAGVHGANPYVVAADAFSEDPIYPFASHRFTSEPKGKLPSWELLNQTLARYAGNEAVDNLLLYRGFFWLTNTANVVLLAVILRRLAPERLLPGLVFYAWNPIVVLMGQSKSDTLMLTYMLLGVLLLVYARPRWSVIPFTVSVFVKLTTLPLLAIDWLQTLRDDRRRALQYVLVASAVVVALYIPYGNGIDIVRQHLGLVGSAATVAPDGSRWALVQTAVFGLCVIAAGLLGNSTPQSKLDRWGLLLLTGPFLLWPLDLSWYMILPVAVWALGSDWRLPAAGFALCFGALAVESWRSAFTPAFPSPTIHATTAIWPHVLGLGIGCIFFLIIPVTRALVGLQRRQGMES